MDWVRLGTLVIAALSFAGTLGTLIVVMKIDNAILRERDLMKEWVRTEIRTAIGQALAAWR